MFKIIGEALCFYKIKNHRRVQVAFLVLALVTGAIELSSYGSKNFEILIDAMLVATAKGEMQLTNLPIQVLWACLLFGLRLALSVVVAFWYASEYIATFNCQGLKQNLPFGLNKAIAVPWLETIKQRLALLPPLRDNEQNTRNFAIKLPQLIVFALVLVIALVLSATAFVLPFFILLTAVCFAPILMVRHGDPFFHSLKLSYALTRGYKFIMFLSWLVLTLFITLWETIIAMALQFGLEATAIMSIFFVPLITLCQGRLLGMFYVFLVEKTYLEKPVV